MGILADFFVANDAIAQQYEGNWSGPSEDCLHSKGIGIVELSMLWALLESKPWEASLLASFQDLKEEGDVEQSVYRLPEELVAALSALDRQAIDRAADGWAKTEELAGSDLTILRSVLDKIAQL